MLAGLVRSASLFRRTNENDDNVDTSNAIRRRLAIIGCQ